MSEKKLYGIVLPLQKFPHLEGENLRVFLSPHIDMDGIAIFTYEPPGLHYEPVLHEVDNAEVYEKAGNN